MTYFCESCGLRIAAPGKCLTCQPDGGQAAHVEPVEPATTKSAPAETKAPAVAARKG